MLLSILKGVTIRHRILIIVPILCNESRITDIPGKAVSATIKSRVIIPAAVGALGSDGSARYVAMANLRLQRAFDRHRASGYIFQIFIRKFCTCKFSRLSFFIFKTHVPSSFFAACTLGRQLRINRRIPDTCDICFYELIIAYHKLQVNLRIVMVNLRIALPIYVSLSDDFRHKWLNRSSCVTASFDGVSHMVLYFYFAVGMFAVPGYMPKSKK